MKSKLPYFLLIIPILIIVGMVVIFVIDDQQEEIGAKFSEAEESTSGAVVMESTTGAQVRTTAQTGAQSPEAEKVELRLEGVVAAAEPADSKALIAVDTFAAVSYRVGDPLDGVAATLKKIESSKSVIVEHEGGRLERLYVAKKEKREMTTEEYIEGLKKRLKQG